MTMGSRWITFALVGAIGYMVAVTFNWPAFAYYPLLNHFSLDLKMPAKTSGPGMMYYGWIVPLILIVYTFIYCGHWFTA